MKSRISVLTLGVADLEKSVRFYRDGLGLPTDGVIGKEFEYGAVAFFKLQKGLILALWPFKSIARDTNLTEVTGGSAAFTIAHNVSNKEEVQVVMNQAEKAGATIIKAPQDTFYGGYAGYFRDINGHIWEIAWNPAFQIEP
jgi:catechol 2,3-dioxygenase-like lactoylglutathione lyase family enzyme